MQYPDFDVNRWLKNEVKKMQDFNEKENRRRHKESEDIAREERAEIERLEKIMKKIVDLPPGASGIVTARLDGNGEAMPEKWNQGCAVWFWRNFSMDYEIYDHEEQAAKDAVAMFEYEAGTPVGIQYSDGRTVKVEDWAEYKKAEETFHEREQTKVVEPPRPTRLILNPFNGAPIRIEADEPQWLGVRPEILIDIERRRGKSG